MTRNILYYFVLVKFPRRTIRRRFSDFTDALRFVSAVRVYFGLTPESVSIEAIF